MLVLVDGYNVTMNDPALAGRSKEVQRDALVERLRVLAPTFPRGARIIIVFDAHGALGQSAEDRGGVRVVYADSADDAIVARCRAAGGNVVVYTADMRLRARISQDVGRHVEYRDVSSLFAARVAKPGTRRDATGREEGLPPGAKKITDELRDLWLDEGEE